MKLLTLVGLIFLSLCDTAPLHGAQDSPHIDLICVVEAIELKAYWRPKTAVVEHNTCELMKELLRQDDFLAYWQFSLDNSESQWALRLSLKDGNVPGEARLWLELQTPKGSKEWSRIWRSPGDLGLRPDPRAEKAPQDLIHNFEQLLEKVRPDLEEKLVREVPIGSGGSVLPPKGRVAARVLSWLPWDRFHPLRDSMFNVFCQHRERGSAVLRSQGHPNPADYRGRGEVVVLIVKEYSFADGARSQPPVKINAEEVQKLQPGHIYLKKYIETEWEVYQ